MLRKTRTFNLRIRSTILYPIELRAQKNGIVLKTEEGVEPTTCGV